MIIMIDIEHNDDYSGYDDNDDDNKNYEHNDD